MHASFGQNADEWFHQKKTKKEYARTDIGTSEVPGLCKEGI